MPAKNYSTYEDWATVFYRDGRDARGLGLARDEGRVSPYNPSVYNQRFATDFSSDPLFARYGSPANHFYFGWDDADMGWPDRGWRSAQSTIGKRYYPQGGKPQDTLESWLTWLYIYGWNSAKKNPMWDPASLRDAQAQPAIGVTPAAVEFELTAGKRDALGLAGAQSPPDIGYVPVPSAVINNTPQPAPIAAPTQPAGIVQGGNNLLGTLIMLKLIRGRSNGTGNKKRGLLGSLF